MCLQCGGLIGRQPVALDIVHHPEGLLPALMVEVSPAMLDMLDQEYQDYSRQPLDHSLLMGWAGSKVPSGRVWVYVGKEERNIALSNEWKRPFQPAPYKYLCVRATKEWGTRFALHSQNNTRPCPFPLMDKIEFADPEAEMEKCRCYKV